MRTTLLPVVSLALLSWTCAGQGAQTKAAGRTEAGKVTAHSRGLHGYIGFSASRPPRGPSIVRAWVFTPPSGR